MGGVAYASVHRLRFNDTDALGHVNNAVFAVMLEQGRAELVRLAGLNTHGPSHMVVIVRMELDFKAELSWPGEVLIETEVAAIGSRSLRLRQRLIQDGKLCGAAMTVIVLVDRAKGRAAVLSDAQRKALEPWLVPEG